MPPFAQHRLLYALWLMLGALGAGAAGPAGGGLGSQTFAPFTFIDASDPQITDEAAACRWRRVVERAIQDRVPLMVVTGDLVNDRTDWQWEQYFKGLAGFKGVLKVIPGNHDVVDSATLAAYRQRVGKDYYSFTYNNCGFVCANTVTLRDAATYPAEYAAQWAWLEKALAEARAARPEHLFLLLHHPPYINEENEPNTYWNFPQAEQARLLKLARAHGVSAIIAGHAHFTLEAKGHPAIYILAGTSINFNGPMFGYRLFKVSQKKFTQEYIEIGKPATPAPKAAVAGTSGTLAPPGG